MKTLANLPQDEKPVILIVVKQPIEELERNLFLFNGRTGERILDFVLFKEEIMQVLSAVKRANHLMNVASRFSISDIGFWCRAGFYKESFDEEFFRGSITVLKTLNYKDTEDWASLPTTNNMMQSLSTNDAYIKFLVEGEDESEEISKWID